VVRVRSGGRAIEIEIWDNGKGFSLTEPTGDGDPPAGLGLTTIRERAHALNGEMKLQSTPGAGTTVLVRLEPHSPTRRDSSGLQSRTIS
ncbi:MAG TPA: ATP-binding protein, partial [Vicinamibacterales bacterium]|nr:ATP-binding protein [Vicinamibacterales bacterium]